MNADITGYLQNEVGAKRFLDRLSILLVFFYFKSGQGLLDCLKICAMRVSESII